MHTLFLSETTSFAKRTAKLFLKLLSAPKDGDGAGHVSEERWTATLKSRDAPEETLVRMCGDLACFHGGRVMFLTFAFDRIEPDSAEPTSTTKAAARPRGA